MNFNHAALYHGDRKFPDVQNENMQRRVFLALIFAPTPAWAHSFKLGNIAIGHAWGLPSSTGETQVFMPLFNSGSTEDMLISASSDTAANIELRLNNFYSQAAETQFVLTPHKPIPMRPTARHLRLLGLRNPLKNGEIIDLTLKFAQAGEIKINIHIQDKAGE